MWGDEVEAVSCGGEVTFFYLVQNMAFFATATLDGTMGNLRANPERAGQNGPARTTP